VGWRNALPAVSGGIHPLGMAARAEKIKLYTVIKYKSMEMKKEIAINIKRKKHGNS
jgi:hypothetical protein